MDNMYALVPHLDSRRSFYRKALVRYEGDTIVLRSYDTDVAKIENGELKIKGFYSPTTLRHIKDFAYQHGFEAHDKKSLEKYLDN